MNRLRTLINTKVGNFLQGKTHPNRLALQILRDLGFAMPEIRKALIDLNAVKIRQLNGAIPKHTFYAVIRGTRQNPVAMEILAQTLNLKVEELFPDNHKK